MKRQYVYKQPAQNYPKKVKKNKSKKTASFAFTSLPLDLQNIIFNFTTINTTAEKPKIAAHTIKSFALTNKNLCKKINTAQFSDQLIKNLAEQFSCSHETISKFFGTQQAKKRLKLQYKLKNLCSPRHETITHELQNLLKLGIDLAFTYNDHSLQKTALAMSTNQPRKYDVLLEHGAHINGTNSHGRAALHFIVTNYPTYFGFDYFIQNTFFAKNKALYINQQDKKGNSPLLLSLIKADKKIINMQFILMITALLNNQADPELANKKNLTPIDAAWSLGNWRIINLIVNAIEKKNRM